MWIPLGLLAFSVLCLLAAGAVAGWIIAECLDERDRRRAVTSHPASPASTGSSSAALSAW